MGTWETPGMLLFLIGITLVSGHIISSKPSKELCDDHSVMGFEPINQFEPGQAFMTNVPFNFPFTLHPPGAPYLSSHASKPVKFEGIQTQNNHFFIPMNNMWPIIPLSQVPINYIALQEKPCVDHSVHSMNKPFVINVPDLSSLPEPGASDCNQEKKEETTPLMIPSAPELPPLKPIELPHLPTISPLLAPSQPTTNVEMAETQSWTIPLAPPSISVSVPIHKEQHVLINIPDAPKLPQFVMPEIPAPVISVIESSNIPAPCSDIEQKTQEIKDESQEAVKPINIPVAPELPPFVMPSLPDIHEERKESKPVITEDSHKKVPLVIPQLPNWQPLTLSSLPTPIVVEDSSVNDVYENIVPTHIPEAPVLPQFLMPAIPNIHETNSHVVIPKAPEVYTNEIHEVHRPIDIPAAPELPAFVMPELPVIKEEKNEIRFEDDHGSLVLPTFLPPLTLPKPLAKIVEKESSFPITNEFQKHSSPVKIPEAPVLPKFSMPLIPKSLPYVSSPEAEASQRPLAVIPNAPELPALVMPEIPQKVHSSKPLIPCIHENSKPLINFSIPNHPQLPNEYNIPHLNLNQPIAYPCACADAIVQQRLIPNLAHNGFNIVSSPTEKHIYAFSSK